METAHMGSSHESLLTAAAAGGAGGGGGSAGRVIANRIFVGNLPPNLVERDLMTLFARFGKIRDVKIIPENTRNRSYGFVTFFSELDARRAIQSALQHDCIMWGERRLNVAPAVKRSVSITNLAAPNTPPSGYYGIPRIPMNQYYPSPAVPMSMPVYPPAEVAQSVAADQQQPVPAVDSNSGMMQTFICRIPHHQYSVPQCQYPTGSPAHTYFVTPSYQPYVQASPVAVNHQAPHYAASATNGYPSTYVTADNGFRQGAMSSSSLAGHVNGNGHAMPLTPNTSADKSDSQLAEGDSSQQTGDKSNNSGEATSEMGHDGTHGHHGMHHINSSASSNATATPTAAAYPPFPTYLCCPHSCMMSPVSPAATPHHHATHQHAGGTPMSAAALSRSCQMLHAAAAANCYTPNSSLIYASSPIVYNSARRSARLQRWNSLDANLGGGQVWNSSEGTAWSRPSLDDSYASETGLGGFSRIDRPLRPAFSCQSHVGMFSPFCRSYEYNLWGVGAANAHSELTEANTIASVGSPSSSSHSSLSLNINLNETIPSDQAQPAQK